MCAMALCSFWHALNDYDNIYTHYGRQITDLSGDDSSNTIFEYDVRELDFTLALYWNECHRFGAGLNLYWTHLRVDGIEALSVFSDTPLAFSDTGNSHSTGLG